MKTQLTVSGFELSAELEKYTNQKLAFLVRRIPRTERDAAECTIKFTRKREKGAEIKSCRIIVEFADQKFRAKEITQHMYTALDIASVDMVQQLRNYKRRLREQAARVEDSKTGGAGQ
jgi:ribosomal subunit interface protein